jgi:hypothetical protein
MWIYKPVFNLRMLTSTFRYDTGEVANRLKSFAYVRTYVRTYVHVLYVVLDRKKKKYQIVLLERFIFDLYTATFHCFSTNLIGSVIVSLAVVEVISQAFYIMLAYLRYVHVQVSTRIVGL